MWSALINIGKALDIKPNILKFLLCVLKLNSYSNASGFFYRFVACAFLFFEVMSVLLIDRYQNATSKAISQHELKKVQLQERYTLKTQDSTGHLKTLCMSVLSLVVALESEWKRYSSSQSDKKTLAFEYEFSLSVKERPQFHFKYHCFRTISFHETRHQSYCFKWWLQYMIRAMFHQVWVHIKTGRFVECVAAFKTF